MRNFAEKSPVVGAGIRADHYTSWLEDPLPGNFTECVTENFLARGGRPEAILKRIAETMPFAIHGVGLDVAGTSPLDQEYLKNLAELNRRFKPLIISDHLCFSRWHSHHSHDLWPITRTQEALQRVTERVLQIQDYLGRAIAVENISTYLEYRSSDIPEEEFLAELHEKTSCGMLFDVNNLYVNQHNHSWDPLSYISKIPKEMVWQYHLADHSENESLKIDTHNGPPRPEVLELFSKVLARFGERPTLLEWDSDLKSFDELGIAVQDLEGFILKNRASSIEGAVA